LVQASGVAVGEFDGVAVGADDRLGPGLEVVPGSAHGHAEGLVAHADFQGFFGGEVVVLAAQLAVVPFGNLRQVHAAGFSRHADPPADHYACGSWFRKI